MSDDQGFRGRYAPGGPEGYYRQHGDAYRNPHEPAIVAALEHAVRHWTTGAHRLDLSYTLDLAAGSGEATLALERLIPGVRIEGMDPYTGQAYTERTGQPCLPVSFEDIALGRHAMGTYSCIVCSCAMHLLEESWLPPVCLALAQAAPDLLVLTPLTRPEIRPAWGWRLMEATHCTVEERTIRLRWYRRVGEQGAETSR